MFAWDILVRIAIAAGFPEAQRLGQTAKWLLPRRDIDVDVGAMQLFFSGCHAHLISSSRILLEEKSRSAALRRMAIRILKNFGPHGSVAILAQALCRGVLAEYLPSRFAPAPP